MLTCPLSLLGIYSQADTRVNCTSCACSNYGKTALRALVLFCLWKSSAFILLYEDIARFSNADFIASEKAHIISPSNNTSMPWSCCDHEAHQYRGILPHGIVKCGKQNTISILNGYCLTMDEKTDTLEAGQCLYNRLGLYNDLPRNKSELKDYMCNMQAELHRTGTLCGKCQDGYYPLAYSFDMTCVQCPNGKSNWWKFVLAAFLPLTIFCIIILFFKINIVSSRFQGFLFYSQMISVPAMMRALYMANYDDRRNYKADHIGLQFLAALYGIWNLDFFRFVKFGICLGTDTLQTLALDFIVGVYPILLLVVYYFLMEMYDRNFRPLVTIWKPFRRLFGLFRENWTSIIDAFATTLLLTNIKFQSVSLDLLTPVKVYHLYDTGNWKYSYRLFYDATVPYFGSRHLPYAIIAVLVFVLVTILPMLLLILYPFRCFQKFLNLFPIRWYILHTFVDSFYGSYKDGTQPGTRDCRWFASLFFLSRFFFALIYAYTENVMYFPTAAMILVIITLLFVTVQPFKEDSSHFTTINICCMLLLALSYTSVTGAVTVSSSQRHEQAQILYLFVMLVALILPLLYISAIVLHCMYSQRKFGTDVITELRNGYEIIP